MIAVYLRHHRSADAYRHQRQQLESLLLADGIGEFEWFIDNADGISSERPALDRLRRAIAKGDVESAYFCSLDRLSRDQTVAEHLVSLCRSTSTRLVSVDKSLADTDDFMTD